MKNSENHYNGVDEQLKLEIQHIMESGANEIRLGELFAKYTRPSITTAIEKAFTKARKQQWDRTFWAVDIHETVLVPNYGASEVGVNEEFYPMAKEVLQELTKRSDVELVLYTCSWPNEIEKYKNFFKQYDIEFKYVNENLDVQSNQYGYYKDKPYMNVLFDDKAGFDANRDWPYIMELLKKYPDGYGLSEI